jgi:hypothetical protein
LSPFTGYWLVFSDVRLSPKEALLLPLKCTVLYMGPTRTISLISSGSPPLFSSSRFLFFARVHRHCPTPCHRPMRSTTDAPSPSPPDLGAARRPPPPPRAQRSSPPSSPARPLNPASPTRPPASAPNTPQAQRSSPATLSRLCLARDAGEVPLLRHRRRTLPPTPSGWTSFPPARSTRPRVGRSSLLRDALKRENTVMWGRR